MSSLKEQIRINAALQFVMPMNRHINCIRLNPGNSPEHEFRKVRIAWELLKMNQSFVMEAKLIRGGIIDLLWLNRLVGIEIMYSETPEELKEKIKKYPSEIEIRSVDSKKAFDNKEFL